MRSESRRVERGFSLVELMVAMTATLVVTGAVYGLVVAGNSAFRREPALADRQQNIRVAMDILTQDLFQAGTGMPSFAQAFRNNLNGVGPMGSGGQNADEIEILRSSTCPVMTVCPLNSDPSKSIVTKEKFSCPMPAIVLMGNDYGESDFRWATAPGQGTVGKNCDDTSDDTAERHGHAVFPPGQNPVLNPTDSFTCWQHPPTYLTIGVAIRYRINVDADGVPNFERSEAGGQDDLDGNSTWQIIARGVEDFQVEYLNAAGWQDIPGTIDCLAGGGGKGGGGGSCPAGGPAGGTISGCSAPTESDYDRLIRRVRVRLSARVTESGPMAGETASAALPTINNAIRGQLVTEVAPRAANTALQVRAGEL